MIHLERTGERVLMSMVVLSPLFALYALWMSDIVAELSDCNRRSHC